MPNEKSQLSDELVAAYRTTHYQVEAHPDFTLMIGKLSPELQRLHKKHGVIHSAYITAYNPLSQPVSPENNARLHQELISAVQSLNLRYYEGDGQGQPVGKWDSERSLLILGLNLSDAQKLGEKFAQNALVWNDADCVPQLILLR